VTAEIIITRGLPGSGKSTWAKAFASLAGNVAIVERDELRLQLFGSYWTGKQEDEERVTRLQEALVRSYLTEGTRVVISDTHLPDRSVKKWLKLGAELGVPVEVQEFRHVPLAQVLVQNQATERLRGGKAVAREVITDKYERFIKGRNLDKVVEYTPKAKAVIEPYVQPPVPAYPRLNAVIFDIDGTLAVMGDRSPYDGAAVWKDAPNHDVATALTLHREAQHTIYIVSGRDEEYRDVTEKWLDSHGLKYDGLFMRPTEQGDKREDSIIKHELFNKYIRPLGHRIVGVYDDRHRVLRMWRKLGLTTFHVNGPDAGDF
jgi:predicted kinase